MNSSGKVLTIFLVIIAILLISLTAISLFFFQQETERRKLAETTLEEFQSEKTELEENLKEIKKQNFLLQEKNKEADDRVNDMSDELELEKGLREEMKIETVALQEQIEEILLDKEEIAKELEAKEKMQEKLMVNIEISKQKIEAVAAKLKAERKRSQKLSKLYKQKQYEMSELEKKAATQQRAIEDEIAYIEVPEEEDYGFDEDTNRRGTSFGVELEEIVVIPGEAMNSKRIFDVQKKPVIEKPVIVFDRDSEGRVLSVDIETEFVIVSLGEMDGIEIGDILSVYRDKDYVGDLRITRLQPEMAAADLIPPFSIKGVKKDDQVKTK